ncbi:gamma-butyrobetaine hydroxylase-like domain-containing protein [Amorphus sp. MBR-141]
MTSETTPWPREIRVKRGRQVLAISWDDGTESELDAEYLRVESPSAEVKGHSEADRKTVGGKRAVKLSGAEPVGNYAVRLTFDDGHSTGIFTYRYLKTLAADRERLWAAYLAELDAKGLSRDRPGQA